jgi:hypothetical protein
MPHRVFRIELEKFGPMSTVAICYCPAQSRTSAGFARRPSAVKDEVRRWACRMLGFGRSSLAGDDLREATENNS